MTPPNDFATRLEGLIERATKIPWAVYAEGTTTQIDAAGNPGGRPCVVGWPGFDSTDLSLKKNRANAELITHLANRAPAIARLVRAARAIHKTHACRCLCNSCIGLSKALAAPNAGKMEK